MGYVKPDVEVRQDQQSNTAVLATPELEACIVGHSYIWVDPTLESSIVSTLLTGAISSDLPGSLAGSAVEATFVLSGNNAHYYDVKGDESLVVVDILGITGDDIGSVKHLLYGVDYSVNSSVAGTQVTISGNGTTLANSTYQVRVGYRAKNVTTTEGFTTIVSNSDIKNTIGEPVSWNPLGFGTQVAMANSASAVNVLKVDVPENGTPGSTDILTAINDYLDTEEVYAIAPMSHKVTLAGLKAHCDTFSLPENKKERIAFVNNVIAYGGNPKNVSFFRTAKSGVATALRDIATAIQDKRVFNTIPDAAYILETRHISTIKPSWIAKSFEGTSTLAFDTNELFAKFASDVTINGILYKAGTSITEAVWATILNTTWGGTSGVVTVLVPVPGYYYCAVAAGQVIGTAVSQPLTNMPTTGLSETFGSQDIFSEALLNTIAEGGNWIYTQDSKTGPIYCRHQQSTDVTTVEKRELSITKALDFAAKFIRKGLKPYIGRYNITPAFIKLLETVLNGISRYLVREGYIGDMKVINVSQEGDTIYIDVDIKVLYPVNYIKVRLKF